MSKVASFEQGFNEPDADLQQRVDEKIWDHLNHGVSVCFDKVEALIVLNMTPGQFAYLESINKLPEDLVDHFGEVLRIGSSCFYGYTQINEWGRAMLPWLEGFDDDELYELASYQLHLAKVVAF